MNERIRQLARQSTGASTIYMLEEEWEKFAELIVGHAIECVRDVLRDENSDLSYVAASQVQKCLREFFGVKE